MAITNLFRGYPPTQSCTPGHHNREYDYSRGLFCLLPCTLVFSKIAFYHAWRFFDQARKNLFTPLMTALASCASFILNTGSFPTHRGEIRDPGPLWLIIALYRQERDTYTHTHAQSIRQPITMCFVWPRRRRISGYTRVSVNRPGIFFSGTHTRKLRQVSS